MIPKSLSSADLCFPPVANKHIYGKFPGGHGSIDIAANFNSQYDKNTAWRSLEQKGAGGSLHPPARLH
jgi:hypothetical protein